ncbi:MAG TPA: hypothetical protein VLA89_13465 [Gemmatimonadales bacterium]|nr:hypothetical protein [Gemmatimonadales bacterium]
MSTHTQRPDLARLTVDTWRSRSPRRYRSELAHFADHYAKQYQESPEATYQAAIALTWDGEIQEG